MTRILTAAVSVPIALAGMFWLPDAWFFLALIVVAELGTVEYLRIVSQGGIERATRLLLILVPVAAALMTPGVLPRMDPILVPDAILLAAITLTLGVASFVVLARVPVAQGLSTFGAIAFGLLYFSIPVASLVRLRQIGGPWLLVLCVSIVWLGDTFAFYCGRRWGRSKLAPSISPNKTKVGSIAGLIAGLIAATVWSLLVLGELSARVLILAVVVGAAAQMGDLVESLLKRGAGVKDSGTLFPGHGGAMDRLDALFFAAPATWLCVWVMGTKGLVP
jgi:phosphatidate cytidylyltransferase